MQFFSLRNAFSLEIGTTYPHSQQVHDKLPHTDSRHLYNQPRGSIWPENTFIPSPVLDKKAKKTDLISTVSFSSGQLIMSSKMKEVIQQFRQTGLQYFKTELINPLPGYNLFHRLALVTNPYWVINCYETDYKYVDFGKSEVNLVGIGGVKIRSLDIKTVWDFYKAENELITIWINKMFLSNEIRDHLLHIPRVSGGSYFVSEILKEALENSGCTGIEFECFVQPMI